MMEGDFLIMILEETAKYLNSSPEGFIYEQFAYFLYFGVYPNSSDMNKLYEIPNPVLCRCKYFYNSPYY